MHPVLFNIPVFILVMLAGAVITWSALAESKRRWLPVIAALAASAVAGVIAYFRTRTVDPADGTVTLLTLPVRTYGTLMLIGFLFGVWLAARRAPLIGVDKAHCLDLGMWGVAGGVLAARLLHVAMYWSEYTPFHDGRFDASRIGMMFKVWDGGLAFYGAFVTVIPLAWFYCRRYKLPVLPFLDIAAPGLIAGQAFGRVGCFMYGCCYGKLTRVPWAVSFPPETPAYAAQFGSKHFEPSSLPVHPTQLYAALAAALTTAFLYAYWPRRRYDGQILALMLIMAGTTRFFEELLRADEPAAFAAVPWMTLAHWFALGVCFTGVGLLFYFRQRGQYYQPRPSGA